ncbi:MAG: hypothetical protein QMB51_03235 [Patescibacteria group bacterium]
MIKMESLELKAKIKNRSQKTNWILFCNNFLAISQLACRELIDNRYKGENPMNPAESISYYRIYFLYIAIVYNLKHAIEIIIKELIFTCSDELNKEDKTHDIKKIFKTLKSRSEINKIKKAIELGEKDELNRTNVDIAKNDIKNIDTYIDNIELIVDKYYYLDFLKDKIEKNYRMQDTDNTSFKYPDNGLEIKLEYDSFIEKINIDDIKNILDDIEVLRSNFNGLGFLLEIYTQYK